MKKNFKKHKLNEEQQLILKRREFIAGMFTAAGGLGLKSLLLGLPPSFIAKRAMAVTNPTFLVFTSRRSADPVNANVPGTYGIGNLIHNNNMGPVNFNLGNVPVTAAQPWANLPVAFRDHLNFFHHRTLTSGHGDAETVMRVQNQLLGAGGAGLEMLPSAIAQYTAKALGTINDRPMDLGNTGWNLSYQGIGQNAVNPTALRDSLAGGRSPQELDLQGFRDKKLNELYAQVKASGTVAQKEFLDRHVTSRDQARELGAALSSLLADVNGNNQADRIIAATAVIASRTAPAVVFGLDFGGDNHGDNGLNREAQMTASAVAGIGTLYTRLTAVGMAEQVTYAQMNVFGRTLGPKNGGLAGRDHHDGHSVLVMRGPKVRPGVTGGIQPRNDKDGGDAMGINSADGSMNSPDIDPRATLQAGAATLMKACGMEDSEIAARLPSGKVVRGALDPLAS